MKKLAILTAMAALLIVSTQPQAALAKRHTVRTYPAVVNGYYANPAYYNGYYGGYGYGMSPYDTGGATVFPDGSFSNNGYSWNGADPTGGATGLSNGYRASRGLPLLPGQRW